MAMKKVPFAFIAVLAVSGCSDGSTGAKGPNASIEASGSQFKLTSTGERMLIKGAENRIAIEAAKRIDVDGAKNDIEVGAATSSGLTVPAIRSSIGRRG